MYIPPLPAIQERLKLQYVELNRRSYLHLVLAYGRAQDEKDQDALRRLERQLSLWDTAGLLEWH